MKVKFDQHFLISKSTMMLEADLATIGSEDTILEIGPGDGRLTHFLLEKQPEKLIVVEKDETFKKELDALGKKYSALEIIFGNGLEEMDKIKFNKIVANIPYSITEPLYHKILERLPEKVILLHGSNFYQIMSDEQSKWHHFINSVYNVELMKDVAGNAFDPPAKTMSVLVLLEKKEEISVLDKLKYQLFLKSKRTTANALQFAIVDALDKSKKEAKAMLDGVVLGFENKIVERLSENEFAQLLAVLEKFS